MTNMTGNTCWQVFILSMQSFTALDISAQAIVASYLGRVSPYPDICI